MIGILLVALAVPLTLVGLGIQKFLTKPKSPPEIEGLRSSLEQAVEKNWKAPEALADGRGIFVLSSPEDLPSVREAVVTSAQQLQGLLLSATGAQSQEKTRLLVRLPAANARRFEAVLRPHFDQKHPAEPVEGFCFYELRFFAP
ncbi:MAG: hypothetical protein IAE94_01580 [Chthoniobacterales bacterium]|nr:hypothetical protein [Chthoniobacterales bacterium]